MIGRFASLPIRFKLQLSLFIIALVLGGLALYATAEYGRGIQPTSGILVKTLAEERTNVLNMAVNMTTNTVTGLTNDQAAVKWYDALNSDPTNSEVRQTIADSFRTILSENHNFRQIRFVSPAGQVLVSVPPASSTDDTAQAYYQALKDHLPIGSVQNIYMGQISSDPNPSVDFVSIPVVNNKTLGYVVVSVDPTGTADPGVPSIYGALRVVNAPSGNIYFYLLSADGKISQPSAVTSPNARPDSINQILGEPFSAPRSYLSPLNSVPALGYAMPINKTQLTLVAETRLIQVGSSNEVGLFFIRMLLVVSGGFLLVALLIFLLDSSIARPVKQLLEMANGIASGRPQSEIKPIHQRDELGTLYQIFSTLTGQFRQDIRTLEVGVAQRTRDIEATRDIGQVISSIRELDALLNQVVELIRQRFENIYHAQVFLLDTKNENAVLRVSTGEAGAKLLSRGHQLPVGGQSLIGQVTAQGNPIVALDTASSPIHKANELLPETRAELALPLRAGGVVIGALDLQSKRTDAFSEADMRLFQNITDQLAIAITNARLFEESRARLTEIEALNRQLIGEAWREYKVERQQALSATGTADSEHWSDLQRQAIERGELVEQISEDTVTFAIPVSLRGQMLGAVEWDLPRNAYNENARQLGRELAARLAITADNARLFEQAQRLAERERLVNDITSKLSQQADVAQILKVAVQELGQALRLPQTSIRLATSQELEPR